MEKEINNIISAAKIKFKDVEIANRLFQNAAKIICVYKDNQLSWQEISFGEENEKILITKTGIWLKRKNRVVDLCSFL